MHAHAHAYRGGAAAAARAICACACRSRACASQASQAPPSARLLPSAFVSSSPARALTTATASARPTSRDAPRTLPVSRAVVARVLMSGRGLSALSSCGSGAARRGFGTNGSSRGAAAAAASASAEADADASPSDAANNNPFGSDEALLAAFDAAWDEHVSKLKEHGHWSETSSEGAALSAAGALKHANLSFARARGDAIFTIDAAKVSALLAPPLPYVDRKTANSAKRLVATYVDGKDLEHGEGGPAKTEDVMRLVLAARFGASAQRAAAARGEGVEEPASSAEPDDLLSGRTVKSPGYLAAAIELLPELARVMAAEPEAGAAARAAEALERAEAAKAAAAAERQAALARGGGDTFSRDDRYGDRQRRDDRFGGGDRFGDRRRSDDRFGDRRDRGDRGDREPRAMRPGDWRCPSCDAHNFAARDACFRCGTLPDPAVAAEAREALAASRAASSARRSFDRSGGGEEQQRREGDWDCEGCGSSNFSWRGSCFRCGGDRPASAGPIPERTSSYGGRDRNSSFGDSRGDRGGGYEQRERRVPSPGDWFCNSCGKDNFARRDSCFSCGTPRAADVRIVPGDPRGGASSSSFGDRRQPRRFDDGEERGPPPPREGDWPCPDCGFSNFASRGSCFRCGGDRPASAGPIPERRSYGGGGGGGGYQRRDGGGGYGGGRGYGRRDDGGRGGGGSNWSSSSGGGAPPPAPVDLDWD